MSLLDRPLRLATEASAETKPQVHRDVLLGACLAGCLAFPSPSLALVRGNSPNAPAPVQENAAQPLPSDDGATAVLDYGRMLAPTTRDALEAQLDELQRSTDSHWKLRIVTGYGPGSTPSPQALQRYWRADSKTIIMTWDEFKGNVLDFTYADGTFSIVGSLCLFSISSRIAAPPMLLLIGRQSLYRWRTAPCDPLMICCSAMQVPNNVFQELRGRFGNMYFINEEGTEEAIKRVTGILSDCLGAGGCTFVPGLSEQQRLFSLVPITSGAFLSGGALRGGLNNRWSYIFLLLWVPWIIGFGYYPLYIRQPEDLSPLIENTAIFAAIFSLTKWSPLLNNRENN